LLNIAKIELASATEVEGHFSDVIYFQGCYRNCNYCFNPGLKAIGGGVWSTIDDIIKSLSSLSDVVVFSGGEPLIQFNDAMRELITKLKLKGKSVVLHTAAFHSDAFCWFDKVLLCIKTWEYDENFIRFSEHRHANNMYPLIIPVVVVNHRQFNWRGFKYLLTRLDHLHIRYKDDKLIDSRKIYKTLKNYKKQLLVFKKLWI